MLLKWCFGLPLSLRSLALKILSSEIKCPGSSCARLLAPGDCLHLLVDPRCLLPLPQSDAWALARRSTKAAMLPGAARAHVGWNFGSYGMNVKERHEMH